MALQRWLYDMSHDTLQACRIGRLQTLFRKEILPADSWGGDISCLVRFSRLERPILSRVVHDFYIFYAPLRYAYEEGWARYTWQNFVRQDNIPGIIASQGPVIDTLPGVQDPGSRRLPYLLAPAAPLRFDIPRLYAFIWHQYFRDPYQASNYYNHAVRQASLATNETDRLYGFRCGRLHDRLSTLRSQRVGAAAAQASVVSNKVDLLDAGKERARFLRETEQNIGNLRAYMDRALRLTFGTAPDDYSRYLPRLILHKRLQANFMDVVSTGDDKLGETVGHGLTPIRFTLPRRFFNEHGWLWGMMLTRKATFFQDCRSPLDFLTHYDDISGDPDTYGQGESPVLRSDYDATTSSTTVLGYEPKLEKFRSSLNYVSPVFTRKNDNFFQDDGNVPSHWADLIRETDDDKVDDWFVDTDFGHLQVHTHVGLKVARIIPPKETDLYQDMSLQSGMRP